MNNKGFAITTILYGTLILFCMLIVSMLGILSTWRNNLDILIDNAKGARSIVTIKKKQVDSEIQVDKIGLYCKNSNNVCKYCYSASECDLG